MNMKKALGICLALLMTGSIAGAQEATQEMTFEQLEGMNWTFSSGAGAWSTDLRIWIDGSFNGEYHDSEMGDAAEEYPNGTVYYASFIGEMSFGEQIDEYSWEIRIDNLRQDETPGQEMIEDDVRYVVCEPYGISEGDVMRLYKPGTPVTEIPEEMRFWAHLPDSEDSSVKLEDWFLCSDKNDSGFVGYPDENWENMGNPWTDMSRDDLEQICGIPFNVPEDAENVLYRWLESESLAEVQFSIGEDDYSFRFQPAALEAGQLMNISGIYYGWENEEPVTIGHCDGTLSLGQADSEDWVELCMWYDVAPGIMYSLSVVTQDPDGLDLTAVAQQVFVPAQGNA